jgi:hypothetical protein
VSGMPVPVGVLGLLTIGSRSAALLWLFFESASYARSMRRRLRLGLADPIVANRFVLWAIWTGALALIPLFVLGLRAALAVLGAGGATAVAAGWLAFFPPASYQRWIGARAVATT